MPKGALQMWLREGSSEGDTILDYLSAPNFAITAVLISKSGGQEDQGQRDSWC